MQLRRNGPLYSPIGCGAALILVLVLGFFLYQRGGTPFSPGPLSIAQAGNGPLAGFSSHAEIEGDCGQCHEPWRGITIERCGQCHKSVLEERTNASGLHGHLPEKEKCQRCHTEHQGSFADITVFELEDFEHAWATDFSLARHQTGFAGEPISCSDCHLDNKYTVSQIDCLECHRTGDPVFTEAHEAFFGKECRACHDGLDSMVNFDHQQVFPLEGAHSLIDCASCHVTTVLAGTANECVGCHAEPEIHMGMFGQDCGRCHTAIFWRPAQLSQHTFPLNHGDEGKIACITCHEVTYAAYTCTNCHAHDPVETIEEHEDQEIFDLTDCASCHPTGLGEEAEKSDGGER